MTDEGPATQRFAGQFGSRMGNGRRKEPDLELELELELELKSENRAFDIAPDE
jgi:hypothetical protein